jgi:hypothetical protein
MDAPDSDGYQGHVQLSSQKHLSQYPDPGNPQRHGRKDPPESMTFIEKKKQSMNNSNRPEK